MNYEIDYNGEKYKFEVGDMDFTIKVDEDISIDYSNIVGDMAYTTILANKVGLLKADLERKVKVKALECRDEEVSYKIELRREAAKNSGFFTQKGVEIKNTEKALEKAHYVDVKWQKLENELYTLERDLAKVTQFFWACQTKMKALEIPLATVYPDDMSEELITDRFNKLVKKKVK